MVYGARPDNPVPLTEDAEVQPCPDFKFAVRRADLERRAEEWGFGRPERVATMLRPAVTVAEEKPGGLARLLSSAKAIRSEEGDPMGQFLHADDLAEAIVVVVDRRPPDPSTWRPTAGFRRRSWSNWAGRCRGCRRRWVPPWPDCVGRWA